MILNYFPMKIDETYEFIQDECEYKDDRDVQEIIYDLLSDDFCKYIIKKGKHEGMMCLKKIRNNKNSPTAENKYCHFHRYREKICNFENCNNKCKNKYNICKKHLSYKTSLNDVDNIYENVFYNSNEENDEINIFNNIDIYTNLDYINKVDNFIHYYPSFDIQKIKICNDFMLQKNYFEHNSIYEKFKEMPIIRYEKFSIIKFLYKIYNTYKNTILKFIEKHNIDLNVLYNLLIVLLKIKNNDKNEITYIKKEEMDTYTSYGVDINELGHFVDEYRNNSEKCNISNEYKKINILKKDILTLFKDYNLEMGGLKKSLISLIKGIQYINSNDKISYKVKYAEIRNDEVCFYENIVENKLLIINNLKKYNSEKINNINFNILFEKILHICKFFNENYIYFENNYKII
jgi:hypothetical protein